MDSNFGAAGREHRPTACAAWSLLLVDAADGLLSETEQAVLDRHIAGCSGCAQELAAAQRGAAWLGLLKGHTPEPPPNLLSNILAKTTGVMSPVSSSRAGLPSSGDAWLGETPGHTAGGLGSHEIHAAQALWKDLRLNNAQPGSQHSGSWFSRWFGMGDGYIPALQPRLAMTSAMAFFSICLTLNLLGFSMHSLRADSLGPAGIQRTVADTSASLVRSFEGIRVVYRVESRVNEWRTANTAGDAPLNHR